MGFYQTTRWRRFREKILSRDNYQCQMNRRFGKSVQASTAHHIFPRKEFPQYTWEYWNMISLSQSEHEKMHDRVTDDLTEYGKELLRKTARKRGMDIPDKYK